MSYYTATSVYFVTKDMSWNDLLNIIQRVENVGL